MTIGKKLIFGFLSLALLVLLSGAVGVVVLKQSSGSADIVGKDKAPIQYAVMNAALTLERVQKLLTRYTHANSGLPELEKDINASFAELDMWCNAIRFGTASTDFTSSPSGKLYTEKKIGIVLRKGSPEIAAVLENAMQLQARWQAQVGDLLKEHTRYVGFDIVVDQKAYSLPVFLNLAHIHHLEWVKQLKDAVNIETTFTGGTEFEKDLVGKWLSSYSVDSQEFMALIGKMVTQQKKLFDLAIKINESEKFDDKLRTYNKGIVVITKIEKYFKEMQRSAAKTYQELDAAKQEKFKAATQSAER